MGSTGIGVGFASRANGVRVDFVDGAKWREQLAGGPTPLRPVERGTLERLAAAIRFEAKPGQSLPWATDDGATGLLLGLDRAAGTTGALRRAAAEAVQRLAPGAGASLVLPAELVSGDPAAAFCAAAEGVLLAGYRWKRSGRPGDDRAPAQATLVADVAAPLAEAALARARALVAGVTLARDLVNEPAADLGPDELADAASEVARRHGMSVEVLRGDEVAARGFPMVAAVGRASAKRPTVTLIRRGAANPAFAWIGKGVTFDSGGLDLKPADAMDLMRKDMAGAATVIGALEALGRLAVDVPFVAALPSAENMVGPASYRPGDILAARDGTTVQIGNTDAEGRLLLADALVWAREQQPARLLDYATLTGAARQALGPDLPALFCNDEELARAVEAAARAADEPVWRLPLHEPYDKTLDVPFADVSHVGSEKRAGAITAALFLRRFVAGLPWAHVDLYAWEDRGRPETPKGGNGMGVRTLVSLAERFACAG